MKKNVLVAAALSIIGAFLHTLCFFDNAASLLCFIAFVPMLIALKKISALQYAAVLTSFNSAVTVLSMRFSGIEMSIESTLGQFLLCLLPWLFYQHIRLRHNEKLGYLGLVSSWIFLEWLASQYFGKWFGLQLGHSLTIVPNLIKWYGFLGVSAGTVWILVINIHISRIILPTAAHTRKHAILNGILVTLLPVLVSLFWPDTEKIGNFPAKILKENGKTILISENNISLSANEQMIDQLSYNIVFDTVKNASIKDAAGKETPITSKVLSVGSIGGVRSQHIMIAELEKNRIGLINGASLLRADLIRLYSLEKCTLLICYSDKSMIARQILRSRAIENNLDILLLGRDYSKLFLKTGKEIKMEKEFVVETKKTGFFTLYGDLIGRLSIFVSLWMLLGSIVKPFRKK